MAMTSFAAMVIGALIFICCCIFVLVVSGVAIRVLLTGTGDRTGSDPDDARMMQEIHGGLSRLEERVESLETIVVERERTDV
ncbi:MAG: hypothetical protein AMXMBFR84_32040 [Candidatus Hydrogenedentota bacterium]